MARCFAFIELHFLLLVFHRLKKKLRLLFTHLTFFFGRNLGKLLRVPGGFFIRRAFYLARERFGG
jgi:hypothetical protein